MKKNIIQLLALLILASVAFAQDPLAVAPQLYKKLFENERVRVLEVTLKPGEKISKHSHPDHFVTVLEPGRIKISKPDGNSEQLDLVKEQVLWIPAETHWGENTGSTTLRLLVSELK
jgi:beta-alanine degradation protein BauB